MVATTTTHYHTKPIAKGVLGELSKVREELEEAEDALASGNPVLMLWELSDMLGAIELLAAKYNIKFGELYRMNVVNQSAFKAGER